MNCTHSPLHGASFFKFEPATRKLTMLAEDLTEICGEDKTLTPPQGKVHSPIVECDGWLYKGRGACIWFFIDSKGDCWFTLWKHHWPLPAVKGDLYQFDAKAGAIRCHKDVLPLGWLAPDGAPAPERLRGEKLDVCAAVGGEQTVPVYNGLAWQR